MRHAAGYALNWPTRTELPVARLDLAAIGAPIFRAPDLPRYPALRLAREVMATRGLADSTLARVTSETSLATAASSLDDILAVDQLARVWSRAAKGQTKTLAALGMLRFSFDPVNRIERKTL